MSGLIKEFLEQAHNLDRDDFVARNPSPVIIPQRDASAADPRNEYRSTLKLKIDMETQEVRVEPFPPSPMDAVISIEKSDRNSFASKVLVGRTETNDIVIPHVPVSKHHAFFRHDPEANRYSITDTGSTNGTKLNNQPIVEKEARYLNDGDQIAFGDVKYTYYSSSGFYDLLRSLSALR